MSGSLSQHQKNILDLDLDQSSMKIERKILDSPLITSYFKLGLVILPSSQTQNSSIKILLLQKTRHFIIFFITIKMKKRHFYGCKTLSKFL
jgi:hypothetical protein